MRTWLTPLPQRSEPAHAPEPYLRALSWSLEKARFHASALSRAQALIVSHRVV